MTFRLNALFWAAALSFMIAAVPGVTRANENTSSDNSYVNVEYDAAVQSYEAGNDQQAFVHTKNVLKDNPQYLPARILLATLFYDNGLFEQSHAAYHLAFEQGADFTLISKNWSVVLLRLDKSERLLSIDFAEKLKGQAVAQWRVARAQACLLQQRRLCAKSEYEAILEVTPGNPLGLNGLALLAIDEKQYDKASLLLEQSATTSSTRAETLWVKGKLAKALRQKEKAQQYFKQAFLLAPDNTNIARSLIDAYVSSSDLDAAMMLSQDLLIQAEDDLYVMFVNSWLTRQMDALSDVRPQLDKIAQRLSTLPSELMVAEPSLLYLGAMVALMQGNFEQAKEHFTSYKAHGGDDIQTAILLSSTYMSLGDKKSAMVELESHEDALLEDQLQQSILLGELYLQNKRSFKAVNLLRKLSTRYPGNLDVDLFSANVELARGNRLRAATQLSALVERFPNNKKVLTAYALYFLDSDDDKKAKEAVTRLHNLYPDDIVVKNIYAAYLILTSQLEVAKRYIEEVLSVSPQNFAARYNSAVIAFKESRTADARALLKALENQNGENAQVTLQLANIDMSEARVEDAIIRYEMLLKKYGPTLSVTMAAVAAYNQLKDYESAINVLRSLEAKEPNNAIAITQLAAFYLKTNELSSARTMLLKLELIAQLPLNILISESQMWFSLGEYEKAIGRMEIAKIQASQNLNVQLQWIKLLLATNNLTRADSELAVLDKRYENHPLVMFKKGELAQQQGNIAQAKDLFTRILQRDDAFDLALAKLYSLSVSSNDFSAFLPLIERIVEQHPTRYFSRNLLAQYHFYYGSSQKALEHYSMLIDRVPEVNKAALLNRLAILYLESDIAKGLSFSSKAYALSPSDQDVLHTYGWALTLNGNPVQALPIIREASVRNATSKPLKYHLAYTLVELGKRDEAKKILLKLMNSPENFKERESAERLLSTL